MPSTPHGPQKDFVATWLLALFLGALGADRFYRGFIGLGLLKLITCGGAGIWYLVDLIIIVTGNAKDSRQLPLENYEKGKKAAWIVTPIILVIGLIVGLANPAGSDEAQSPEQTSVVAEDAEVEIAADPPEDQEPAAEESAAAEPDDAEPAEEPSAETATTEDPTDEPADEPEPAEDAPTEAPAADLPAAQIAMSDAVAQGRTDAGNAETDLQRANTLNVRNEALCAAIPDGEVADWIGTVRSVDANGEGKAVVKVEIDEDIEIGTWNNAFSDVSDNTLIEQGEPLYDQALALVPGDSVRFSGTLKSGDEGNDACYYTSNITEVMAIDSPDFIITFSALEKVE